MNISYIEKIKDDLQNCMESLQVQPILFVGSGLSQRYCNLPNWQGLMEELADECPNIKRSFAYYEQNYDSDYKRIASDFSSIYSEWAWEVKDIEDTFPANLFEKGTPKDIYLKHIIAKKFREKTESLDFSKSSYAEEIECLKKIKPHAVITTNYDLVLEKLFDEYTSIIGQQIIQANFVSPGEILKIHGCCSNEKSIVITQEDYENFEQTKKYLSAKLLTYFAEHPLFFVGYSCSDPNITTILADIDQILCPNGELIPNIYLISYDDDFSESKSYPNEVLIPISGQKSVRIKVIYAKDYKWIYEAIAESAPDIAISPKILRALLARTYKLVSKELPRQEVEFDIELLKNISEDDKELPKLFGISEMDNGQVINANYIFTFNEMAKALGYKYWHGAQLLIDEIEEETGHDIKASDNRYHIKVSTGLRSHTRKYSKQCLDLLTLVRDKKPYSVNL
ncbi:TPA: SIR2 family protein [Acinetobacter baumannii]|nr:SIR2 family protein [Acinetobacter baumannii]MDV7480497.1 SIR2 family protein [Acinetobacter baumannii]HEE5436319.1 SIR2 family protein [Acinetobacter baumannii]